VKGAQSTWNLPADNHLFQRSSKCCLHACLLHGLDPELATPFGLGPHRSG
jgi:hypothetical protein